MPEPSFASWLGETSAHRGTRPRLSSSSIDEAASALGIGRSRLYAEIGAQRITSIKVGRRRLVSAGAIADFIAAGSDRDSGPAA